MMFTLWILNLLKERRKEEERELPVDQVEGVKRYSVDQLLKAPIFIDPRQPIKQVEFCLSPSLYLANSEKFLGCYKNGYSKTRLHNRKLIATLTVKKVNLVDRVSHDNK